MRQLEFKGKGWGPEFREAVAIEKLLAIAYSHLDKASVHMDSTMNQELWRRSRIKWDNANDRPKSLEVYYHNNRVALTALSHEVGHLETMAAMGGIGYYSSGPGCQYKCEYIASEWALDFLRKEGCPAILGNTIIQYFQACLDGYRDSIDVCIPSRLLLIYNEGGVA